MFYVALVPPYPNPSAKEGGGKGRRALRAAAAAAQRFLKTAAGRIWKRSAARERQYKRGLMRSTVINHIYVKYERRFGDVGRYRDPLFPPADKYGCVYAFILTGGEARYNGARTRYPFGRIEMYFVCYIWYLFPSQRVWFIPHFV